jgi:hypothetical protein
MLLTFSDSLSNSDAVDPDRPRSEAVQRIRGVLSTSCGLQKAVKAVRQSLVTETS